MSNWRFFWREIIPRQVLFVIICLTTEEKCAAKSIQFYTIRQFESFHEKQFQP